MGLIRVPQQRPEDLAAWECLERDDAVWARTPTFHERCAEALVEIERFARAGPCYAAISWGKDSTVLAHLLWTLREERNLPIPLVWNRNEHIHPWTGLVRDEFLDRWWGEEDYWEVEHVRMGGETLDQWYWRGWRAVVRQFGPRWIGGLRAEESSIRARRIDLGLSLERSCQPLGRWVAGDIFAYLYAFDLPVHPVYACSCGGSLDRGRLRVAGLSLGEGYG